MNLTIEDINETRKKLVISVSAQETEEEEKQLIKEFAEEAHIPGFRPGKAPEHLVRKRYAKSLATELKRKLSSKACRQALEESGMEIYSIVNIEEDDFKPREESEIVLTVDITPTFDLPEYKGIPTEVLSTEVSGAEIHTAIDEIRKQRSQFKIVERAAEKGDFAKISYEGIMDGRAIAEIVPDEPIWGKQESTWEEAGAEETARIKAVGEGLVGMRVGDKKQVEMEFPKEFEIAELAGKRGVYSITVHEVRERVLPELTEDFLKSLQVGSFEQLKEQIRKDLKSRKEQEKRRSQRRQITDALSSRVQFPLAESAIEFETQAIMRDIVEVNIQRGLAENELEKHKEEIFQKSRLAAEGRVKVNTLLSCIAEEEKITVKDEDIQHYLLAEAHSTGTPPQQLIKELKNNHQRVVAIRQSIMRDKALALLIDESVATVKKD